MGFVQNAGETPRNGTGTFGRLLVHDCSANFLRT